MPFLAGRGAWPSALSRARGFRVHRSAAKTLDRTSGRIRRRFSAGRAGCTCLGREVDFTLGIGFVWRVANLFEMLLRADIERLSLWPVEKPRETIRFREKRLRI